MATSYAAGSPLMVRATRPPHPALHLPLHLAIPLAPGTGLHLPQACGHGMRACGHAGSNRCLSEQASSYPIDGKTQGVINGAMWYNVYGSMADWSYKQHQVLEVTLEVGPCVRMGVVCVPSLCPTTRRPREVRSECPHAVCRAESPPLTVLRAVWRPSGPPRR